MKLKILLIAALSLVVTMMPAQTKTAYAVYCSENTTFYFLNSSETLSKGGTFTYNGENLSITEQWSGKDVTDYRDFTGAYFSPRWYKINSLVTSVVIDESFKEVTPKTFYYWFGDFANLSSVTGLENLNTSKAVIMNKMFQGCSSLTELDLSSFNTAEVTDMGGMFRNCSNLSSIVFGENFNTAVVTTMEKMFEGCSSLHNIDLNGFNTSNVQKMNSMFSGCSAFTELDLSSFNTENVNNMNSMFSGCSAFTELDLSNFNTGNVTGMSSMFQNCSNLTYIDKSDDFGANATTTGMYDGCDPLLGSTPYVVYDATSKSLHFLCNAAADLTEITINGNTITLTDLENCWRGNDVVTNVEKKTPGWKSKYQNITAVVFEESFKFARPTNCYKWFEFCGVDHIEGFNNLYTSKVTDMSSMFENCYHLVSLAFSENFNTSNVTNMCRMFSGCDALEALDMSNFNTSNVTNMSYMFNACYGLKSEKFKFGSFNTSNVTNMENMFAGCRTLGNIDLSGFNTSKVTDMSNMFSGCSSLPSISFGDNFNTSNVERMANMFYGCSSLLRLDLSGFNTSKVKNMSNMFYRCTGFQSLDLSSFDLESVTDMSNMFRYCSYLESIKTGEKFTTQSPITDLSSMFRDCNKLTSLDLSGIKTDASTKLNYMFDGCTALQSLDISNFKPKQSTDVAYMFRDCTALTALDIRNFYVSEGISTDLANCKNLMKLNMSAATGDVNLLADNTAFDGRGMMISVPDGFDLANVSTENYIVKTTGTSFARAFTSGNMSTICLPYAVDATAIAEQGTLYKYVDIVDNAVKFTAVEGCTTPGEAYLFKPATSEKVFFTGTDAMTDLPAEITEGTGAGLYGTYTGKKFTADEAASGIYFGWANGSFWRAGENAEVKHDRAYLKTAAGTTPARLSVKLDDETTGISDVNTTADDDNASAFDLMGRRVGTGYKGIVIKNGKKVFK